MPSSTFSSKPLALLLGLAVFAGLDRFAWSSKSVARFLLQYQPIAASGDTIGVSARIRLSEPWAMPHLVFLGSSQIREGVDCAILTAGGGSCLNLGIGGGSPLDMLYISRELNGRGPRTLVVSIFPGVLHKAPKSGFIDTQTIRAIVQSGAIANATADDLRRLGLGLLQSFSPTLRHREGLREIFGELARERPDGIQWDRSNQPRRTTDRDRKAPRYFAGRVGRIDVDTSLSAFTAAEDMALRMLIAREVESGRQVVIVDFPTRPGFETTLSAEVRSHYAQLLSFLKSRSDVRFLEASALGPLSEENFLDFTHVDSNGRRLVSERLGRLLGADLLAR